ncbi:MAG: hypothetical protein WKG52_11485 [Variovorax sp.]
MQLIGFRPSRAAPSRSRLAQAYEAVAGEVLAARPCPASGAAPGRRRRKAAHAARRRARPSSSARRLR